MSRHHYPICPISGKARYRGRRDIKLALRRADWDRSRAAVNDVGCNRREVRGYQCPDCNGWHLTSQPETSVRMVPVQQLSSPIPEAAAEAIRRMVAATGLRVDSAA
jgi:hypothetical protein